MIIRDTSFLIASKYLLSGKHLKDKVVEKCLIYPKT